MNIQHSESFPYLKGRGLPHASLYSFMKASMSSPCLLYKRTDLQGYKACQCTCLTVHLTLLTILALSLALCPSTCSCHAFWFSI